MEREAGCRVDSNDFDSNDFDNNAIAGLFGALARAMGQADHKPTDDMAAGMLIRHQISPNGRRERESREMMANLFVAGFSPDDVKAVSDRLNGEKNE